MKKISKDLKVCTQCLNDNLHPFGLDFDKNGTCYGCEVHKEKNNDKLFLDSKNYLKLTISKLTKDVKCYDCIIPIKGSAEDYFVVDFILKEKLNPLIIIVNNHFLTNLAWHNIHNLITYYDLDAVTYSPEINIYKSLIRSSLVKFNDIYWPYRYLNQSYTLQVAIEKEIPLIIWGGYQPIEFVGKFSHKDKVEMSEWSLTEHDLHGQNLNLFMSTGSRFNENKFLKYPNYETCKNVRGIYLSNYLRWDPWEQNSRFKSQGFLGELSKHTFDIYENVGSSTYYQIHDLLRIEKYGYKKVREQLSREIRHERISRDKALNLYELYLNQQYDVHDFFNWLDVTKSGMEWWIKHRLKNTKKLIGPESKKINWEEYFSEFFNQKTEPSINKFVTFQKGI